MRENKLAIVSNRLPIGIKNNTITPSDGGLVSAINGAHLAADTQWIGHLGCENHSDKKVLQEFNLKNSKSIQYLDVNIPSDLYDQYYNGYCNQVLWPSFHERIDLIHFYPALWEAYSATNIHFAHYINEQVDEKTSLWIQDYHLLLLPKYIKQLSRSRKVSFFLHIPWPSLEIAKQVPFLEEIAKSLSYADMIAFHTKDYEKNFLDFWYYISEDFDQEELSAIEHKLYSFPIGISPQDFIQDYSQISSNDSQLQTIVGVDRFDYSKGIDIKLKLIEHLLETHPEYREKIKLRQLLIPTRQDIPAYQDYREKVLKLADRINNQFKTNDWTPIELIEGRMTKQELIKFYQSGDLCLVSSIKDGMNLVSMEYLAAQSPNNPGQLFLSDQTGASKFLGSQITFNPFKIKKEVKALVQSLQTNKKTRQKRWRDAMKWINKNTSNFWASNNLNNFLVGGGKYFVGPRSTTSTS